jgi:hypothetical protein
LLGKAFQRFHLTAAEKRTYSACKGCGSIGGYAFEFVGAYLRSHLFDFNSTFGNEIVSFSLTFPAISSNCPSINFYETDNSNG